MTPEIIAARIRDAVVFTLSCEPEDCAPDFEDPALNDTVSAEVAAGNDWAWCTACVKATLPGTALEATEYLGGCCYKDADDFRENSGYFGRMCGDALLDLAKQIAAIQRATAAPATAEDCAVA